MVEMQHMMKRIQRGPVRGISLKLQVCRHGALLLGNWQDHDLQMQDTCTPLLQEEERERRMDFVPEESAVNTEQIEVRIKQMMSENALCLRQNCR